MHRVSWVTKGTVDLWCHSNVTWWRHRLGFGHESSSVLDKTWVRTVAFVVLRDSVVVVSSQWQAITSKLRYQSTPSSCSMLSTVVTSRFYQDKEKQEKLEAEKAERERKQHEEERLQREKEEKIEQLTQIVPPEPHPNCGESLSKIRFRPPSGGAAISRTFLASEKLQGLLNFVGSLGYLSDKYRVITSYPKRDISSLDARLSLKEHKLFPQETLIIEEITE